jgi:hypothetical protein
MMEADALAGLKKFRGKLEHKTWAEKQGVSSSSSSSAAPSAPQLDDFMKAKLSKPVAALQQALVSTKTWIHLSASTSALSKHSLTCRM